VNARYLTDFSEHSLNRYLPRQPTRLGSRRDRVNLRSLLESIGWVCAGAAVGCTAVMLGAWGLLRLTDPQASAHTTTAMVYYAPAALVR
jgi:hypothetical protein